MYGFIMTVATIGFLTGLIGSGLRLPFFGNNRGIGLVVCILSLVIGVPLAKAVRTPAQVAEDASTDERIAAADARGKAVDDARKGNEGYSDTAVIAGAKSAVQRKLVDDRSARFRDVTVVVQAGGTKAVCGEVNSKNRAGGYAGYQRFISAGTDEHTYLEEQVPDFATAWNQVCVR
ncbi:MAG: hypothetical protein ACT6RD_00110 [Brevundimonas sp.]|uniref:hypothetical protein n=1 Tax=Brevundimonas sp. TaxID=1871086 RepID=UPI0040346345